MSDWILIVDDDPLNLKVACRLLGRYHFRIDTCMSGKECVYKVKSEEQYDMIFLDPVMPEMDGLSTLRIMRKLEDYHIKVPPVVALTANAFSSARNYYLSEGFDEYLSKPINLVELDIIINKYFANKKSE